MWSILKVLHFSKTYYPDFYGGIEPVIFQLCEGAPAYGIDSTVLALSLRGYCEPKPLGQHHTAYRAVNFKFASTLFSFGALARFRQLAAGRSRYGPFPFSLSFHGYGAFFGGE